SVDLQEEYAGSVRGWHRREGLPQRPNDKPLVAGGVVEGEEGGDEHVADRQSQRNQDAGPHVVDREVADAELSNDIDHDAGEQEGDDRKQKGMKSPRESIDEWPGYRQRQRDRDRADDGSPTSADREAGQEPRQERQDDRLD